MGSKLTESSEVQVEFSPTAWRQVGALPWETFNRVRTALSGVKLSSPQPGGRLRLRLDLGDWVALCDLEPERKALTVLGLVKVDRRRFDA